MTEADWNSGTDPQAMLDWLCQQGQLSERKARLFCVACCRRIEHLLVDDRSRQAVRVVELVAEGRASLADLGMAEADAEAAYEDSRPAAEAARARNAELSASERVHRTAGEGILHSFAAFAAAGTCRGQAIEAAGQVASGVTTTLVCATVPLGALDWGASWSAVDESHTKVIKDLFGPLPFRPVALPPSLLKWKDGTVVQLARAIYDERRFTDLPILADALEEAGVTDKDVLGHCRQPGEHARGCWVLDRLLSRE